MKRKLENDVLTHWTNGEWDKLTEISYKDLKKNSDKRKMALLVGSAYQHNNNFKKAKKYFQKAFKFGANQQEVFDICFSDISNTRARICALLNKTDEMNYGFQVAVEQNVIEDKRDSNDNLRMVKELASLGLFLEAKDIVALQLDDIMKDKHNHKSVDAKVKMLQTELELLSHELSISQMRMQLFSNANEQSKSNSTDIEELRKRSVSQLGQDLWVLEKTNFKRNGFFVEFGATDGVLLSNSYLLEKEFGWSGICAEPNPKFYKKLQTTRDCTVSNECIGAITGEKVNFVFAQEYGGMQKHMDDDSHKDKRQAYLEQGQEMELETISLHDFLVKHNAPKEIDYLSIDTEGSEYEILKSFPFKLWDIKLLTIEHNYTTNRKIIRELMEKSGYQCIEVDWDDWYFKPGEYI